MSAAPMLEVRGLVTTFMTGRGPLRAVAGVDLDLGRGEVLGLVGESGCGKSAALRSIARLFRPPIRTEGRVLWEGRDLMALPERAMRAVRGREIGMIFQEPGTALNPVLTVGRQITEVMDGAGDRAGRRRRATQLMEMVGIPAAAGRLDDHPHQFSGGMRQRAMIAVALAASPRLLLADEPTTALDVTIQDQILKLLLDLVGRLGMGMILVTHDLGVVAETCDRVAVMYAGRIVEEGPVAAILASPHHPYTAGLIASLPRPGAARAPLRAIEGAPPSLLDRPPGCSFAARCRHALGPCMEVDPALEPAGEDRRTACLRRAEILAGSLAP
jgi:peptide/nickel transport system ATP-binding protein/oligopeptide transport system ATP-binding protein